MSWTLTIHLTGGDRTYDILYNGWDFPDEVGAKGAHLTQSLKLTIKSAEAFALFLSETSRLVKAEVKHDNTVMFEGVIRPYLSVSARGNYEEPISVQVMDYTEALHIVSGEDRNDCGGYTLAQCVDYLFNLAGITTTRDYPAAFSSDTVEYLPIKSSEYYDAVLTNLLFERGGWDYKFTPGHVKFYKTEAEEQPNTAISDIRDSLNINREDYWADGISVKYMKLKSDNIVLFRQDAEIPYSDSGVVFPARTNPSARLSYPGGVTFTDARGLLYDGTYNASEPTDEPPSGKGQVSWSPEYNEKSGSEITPVSISNVSVKCSWDKVNIKQENPVADNITVSGARLYVGFKGTFTFNEIPLTGPQWAPQWHITASGHVVYLCGDSEEYVENTTGSRPENTTRTLKYVYDSTMAQNYAKRELKRQKTAGITYSFKSLTAYEAGTFHLLNDSVTGVQTTVRVLSCRQAANGIYTIKAEGADIFSLPETVLKALYYSDMFRVAQSDFRIISDITDLAEGQTANLQLAGAVVNAGDDVTFSWKLNGVSIGTGKTKEIAASSLSSGSNEVTCSIVYNSNVIQTASITLNLHGASQVVPQYYVSTSKMLVQGGSWLNGYPYGYSGYLWRRLKIVNSNGGVTYTDPVYILKLEDVDTNLVTNEIQYGLSTSDTTYNFPFKGFGYDENSDEFEFGFEDVTEWSSDYDNWYKGLYVWQRLKTTDADGVVTYGEPTYCKEITEGLFASCQFELVVENSEFVVDKSQNGSFQYSARLVVTGYSDSALATTMRNVSVLNEDGSSTGISNVSYSAYSSGVIAFNISKSTDSMQIKISVDGLYGESASALMSAKDITSYVMFAGCVTTNTLPVTRLDGTNLVTDDYFIAGIEITTYPTGWSAIDSDEKALLTISKGTPFIYIGNQTWKKIGSVTNMDIAMGCLGGILDAGVDMTDSNNMYYTWLVNLVAQNAVIANLFTKNLVFSKDGIMWGGDVTVDADGRPVKTANGYTIGSEGGFVVDASGFFQCKEALIESATIHNSTIDGSSVINGTIENYDATSGEVVFKTNKISQSPIQLKASKIDGTSVPSAYSKQEWYDVLNSWLSSLDENVSYAATGSIFNVVSALFVRRSVGGAKTKVVNGKCSGSSSGQWRWDNDTGQQIYVSAEINGNYTAGFLWVDQYNSRIDVSVYNSDGTIYSTPIHREPVSARYQSSKTNSFYIPKGGYVVGTVAGGGGQSYYVNSGYFYLYYSESENFSEGINIIYDSENHILLSDIPRTGYGTSDTYLNVDNVVKSITMTANSTWEVNKYYRFSYTSGYEPVNTSFAVTSLLSNADFEFPDGTTRTIAYIKYKSDELVIYTTDNNSYDFLTANGNYYRSHEVDISVMSAILGAFAQNLMPIYNSNLQRVGSGYVGSETEPWYQGWAETGWLQGSARARKDNVERMSDNAVEIIRSVDVVSFTYKCDKGNPKGYRHYGFIADDTDERLSSPFHNVMEIGNCIGILIKAVQELSAELDRLKGV